MTMNDYIAEYVKENHPEILNSVSFQCWKFLRVVRDAIFMNNQHDEDLEIALEKALEQIEREEEEVKWHFAEYADKHGYDRDYDDLFHFGLSRAYQIVKRLVDGSK